jgi:hypothetical protein
MKCSNHPSKLLKFENSIPNPQGSCQFLKGCVLNQVGYQLGFLKEQPIDKVINTRVDNQVFSHNQTTGFYSGTNVGASSFKAPHTGTFFTS